MVAFWGIAEFFSRLGLQEASAGVGHVYPTLILFGRVDILRLSPLVCQWNKSGCAVMNALARIVHKGIGRGCFVIMIAEPKEHLGTRLRGNVNRCEEIEEFDRGTRREVASRYSLSKN